MMTCQLSSSIDQATQVCHKSKNLLHNRRGSKLLLIDKKLVFVVGSYKN